MDLYETYIRTKEGETYHPNDIREALEQFFSDDGYRLSFNIDGVVFTLRKNHPVDSDMQYLDEKIGSESVECALTVRRHRR